MNKKTILSWNVPLLNTELGPLLFGHTAIQEQVTAWLAPQLTRLNVPGFAYALLWLARRRVEGRPIHLPELTPAHPELPTGPYFRPAPGAPCSLLAFPPESLDDRLVDLETGGYGYSRLAVDLGEEDGPSGRRVMLELPIFAPARRVFLDRYGNRPSARILLGYAGVNCDEFATRLAAQLTDSLRIVEENKVAMAVPQVAPPPQILPGTAAPLASPTWNAAMDATRLFSSPLLVAALPPDLLSAIRAELQAGLLNRTAASLDKSGRDLLGRGEDPELFITPNGFCEYFGAPRGPDLIGPAQPVYPARGLHATSRAAHILNERRWRRTLLGLSLTGGLVLGGALARRGGRLRGRRS